MEGLRFRLSGGFHRSATNSVSCRILTGKYDERTGDPLTDRSAQSFGP
jgi:hypothetical protein